MYNTNIINFFDIFYTEEYERLTGRLAHRRMISVI